MVIKAGSKVSWECATGKAFGQVKEVVTVGGVPEIDIAVTGTDAAPAALIEVEREGKLSGIMVGLHIVFLNEEDEEMSEEEAAESEEPADRAPGGIVDRAPARFTKPGKDFIEFQDSGTGYRMPTATELDKINQFTPADMKPLDSTEVAIVTFVAADNLVNRGLGKWREDGLTTLAKLSVGLPFLLDHDWGEVVKSQGLIFDARVVKSDSVDRAYTETAGNGSLNRAVVKAEGFAQVQVDVSFPISSPALQMLKYGLAGCVSMGGFDFKDFVCPLCNVSFDDKHCPHFIPSRWYGETSDADDRFAPYYIRSGVYDLGELSLVTIPNLPMAGNIKRWQVPAETA